MAVLSVILLLFSQIVANVADVVTKDKHRIETSASARLALDRIASDLAGRVARKDADFLVIKRAGNDAIYFHAAAPAAVPANQTETDAIALVGYFVPGDSNAPSDPDGKGGLKRVGKALPLSGTGAFAHLPERLAGTTPGSLDTTFVQTLAEEVFRFEVEFLLDDGSISANLPTREAAGLDGLKYLAANGQSAALPASSVGDFSTVRAILVSIACLPVERKKLLSEAQIDALSDGFPDSVDIAPGGDRSAAGTGRWAGVAESANYTASIPQIAAAAVRVYRKSIPLHD